MISKPCLSWNWRNYINNWVHVSPGLVLGNGERLEDRWNGTYWLRGIFVGRFKCGKMGAHRKKNLFINNSVGTLILLKEGHQGLLKLHVHLGRFQCGEKNGAISKKRSEAERYSVRRLFRTYWNLVYLLGAVGYQVDEYKNSGLVVILHCLNSFQHNNYVAFSLLYVLLRENHKYC